MIFQNKKSSTYGKHGFYFCEKQLTHKQHVQFAFLFQLCLTYPE